MTLPRHLVKLTRLFNKDTCGEHRSLPTSNPLCRPAPFRFRIDQVHPRAGDARKRRQKGFSIELSLNSRA